MRSLNLFSLPNPPGSTMPLGFTQLVTEMSTWMRGVKRGRCVRLTTLPPSSSCFHISFLITLCLRLPMRVCHSEQMEPALPVLIPTDIHQGISPWCQERMLLVSRRHSVVRVLFVITGGTTRRWGCMFSSLPLASPPPQCQTAGNIPWVRDTPLSAKDGTNFADKRRSLGRYSSLAD
jgi:hypothetical protein